jgi:NADH:ubiquinone oxidoreductase subunit 2 (subunit N)
LYFFITLESAFNSTDWTFLNFASNFIDLPKSFYIYFYFFIVAFFLKLGITPFHLYKIEVYKGLPYISLYIYTIIFFFIYFFFFACLIIFYLKAFAMFYWTTLIICILLGTIYVISMLFDINFSKSFFAYSTIVNTVSFLLVLISNF